ncbi:hypothetical protein FB561_0688 [Kribbella amoyensis]|uniref:Subtilisin inhibitor-like n=1 Tax=Kribbella amoyensis TaxID=996641 RepID=A0A561BL61_9ACTN|nr:hypothetical protein [Kribbella amoyensis]TWD79624.1 hypothetical protein FB561_0688 [Kribbella amoyensis]
MKRLQLLAAVALAASVALTGCGAEPDDNQVASAGGAQPQADGSTSAAPDNLSKEEKGVKFAQCLREHGLNVPDPEPGQGIQLKVGPESGMSREDVDKAMEACKQYSPQGDAANPEMEARGREYAKCMRDNGVEKFQDPKPGQRGIMVDKNTAEDPDFEKAQQACQSVLAAK